MNIEPSSNVIAFRGAHVVAEEMRKLRAREQAIVPPPAVPYISLRSTDPSQKVFRTADNAFRIEGVTTESEILQTLMELVIEGKVSRVLLGRAESAHRTGQRIAAAVPVGYRAELRASLPLGSWVIAIERDDESRRETAAA